MIYPLDSSLKFDFEIYLENDTIRPELFIEKITRDIENPREFLARLFNHVLYTENKELRHYELLESLEGFLAKKHFVQVFPGRPLVISYECFTEMLPNEIWDRITSRLGYKSLLAFSDTCRRFRQIAHIQLGLNPVLLPKYVRSALVGNAYSFFNVERDSFDTSYDLDLPPRVTSPAIFTVFSNLKRLRILHADSSLESIQTALKALPKLRGLVLANLKCLTDKTISTLELPAGLSHCTLWAETNDTAISTLARRCSGLSELVVCNARSLTAKAFSGKMPFKNLTKLHLYSVNYSEETLRHIFLCSPKIENLSLAHCVNFVGSSLVHLRFLKELNVSQTSFHGDHFKTLMQNSCSLISIDVSFCEGIASEDFEDVKYPETLKRFIGHWTEINDVGLRNIIHTTMLDSLELTSCIRLTNAVFEEHPELLANPNYDFGISNA